MSSHKMTNVNKLTSEESTSTRYKDEDGDGFGEEFMDYVDMVGKPQPQVKSLHDSIQSAASPIEVFTSDKDRK